MHVLDTIAAFRAKFAQCLALLALLCPASALAGGYLDVFLGVPSKWDTSSAITLNRDLGSLGALTNAQADTLVANAVAVWSGVATCDLTFANGADLASDQTGSNMTILNNINDGINPIVYDTDGSLVDALIGAGANQFVIGFAGADNYSINTIIDGYAVLNGRFIDGAGSPSDLTQTEFTGVMTHELGHFLNLDHSQINDSFAASIGFTTVAQNFAGYPTMYPNVHSDISTLAYDDIVWISKLYPAAGYAASVSRFTGTVRNVAGTVTNGANIIARNISDPIGTVVSCVSGWTDANPTGSPSGTYEIPGLTPGSTWVLDYEPIHTGFTGGSSVGQIDPPLAVTSPLEFINDVDTISDDPLHSTTFTAPAGGGPLSGLDLRFNTVPSGTTVAEVDSGTDPFTGQTVTIIPGTKQTVTGSVNSAESGTKFSSAEDWFIIAPAASAAQEIWKIVLTPTSGSPNMRLLIVNSNGSGIFAGLSGFAINAAGAGGAETSDEFIDTARYGSGADTGKVYVGVDATSGSGNYTLAFDASYADSSAVMVGGTSAIDPFTGSFTISGQHFSNSSGVPTVTLSDPNITVGTVTFNSATMLTVAISNGGGFTPGTTDVTVTNVTGGYSGTLKSVATVPVVLSGFGID